MCPVIFRKYVSRIKSSRQLYEVDPIIILILSSSGGSVPRSPSAGHSRAAPSPWGWHLSVKSWKYQSTARGMALPTEWMVQAARVSHRRGPGPCAQDKAGARRHRKGEQAQPWPWRGLAASETLSPRAGELGLWAVCTNQPGETLTCQRASPGRMAGKHNSTACIHPSTLQLSAWCSWGDKGCQGRAV